MYEKKVNELVELFEKLQYYPYALDEEGKDKIERRIIRIYKKGDDTVKGMVIFYINEKLSKVEKFRQLLNMEKAKEMRKERGAIAKEVLDFFSSLDGQFFLLELLGKLDDTLALRLLSYYLSRYLSLPGKAFGLLVNKALCVLGDSNNPYALEILLELKGLEEEAYYAALDKWRLKVGKIKDKEKRKRLVELFKSEREKGFFS